MIDTPRLSAGAVNDILRIICAENGVAIDDLPNAELGAAIMRLSEIARDVHRAGHLSAR